MDCGKEILQNVGRNFLGHKKITVFFADTNINFWDGCKQKDTNYVGYLKDLALATETGREIIKNGEYTISEDGSTYSYPEYLSE